MFEELKDSLRELISTRLSPDDRRAAVQAMRDALVRAKLGIDDLRAGVGQTRTRLAQEEAELATIDRRRQLAEQIQDAETVAVATRYAEHHAERLAVLRRKLEAQEAELALAERDVGEMTQQLRVAASGGMPGPAPTATVADALDPDAALARDFETLSRSQAREARELDADARLAELKRRMGQ
ncbi:MAG: hypothetical protein HYX65_11220 [Gemmatimonadetes bacterium]|nr:hypothetical protein [Gemmatimonadota bacterium]